MADVLSKLAVVITANTAQMSAQLKTANKSLGLMTSTVNSLKTALIGSFGAYAVIGAIKNSISIIADFEKQMSKVRAITGATGEDFARLEKNALDLGKSTEYTARQIASLQVEYGRLGFSTKEILNSTKATLNLATATGEDLTRSAEIAGSTLRAFQLDAKEMGRVTDVITGALNKSALALDTFADGMKYVAPVAEATNVSIEETSALLSVLADAGIKGSQAGTSLRRIFTLLTKDGGTLQDRLAKLGKEGITLAGANDEVGLYAQTALLVIVKQIEKVNKLAEEFKNLNGEAERTAEIMRDNLSGDFDKLTSAIEGVVLEGSAFNGFLRGTIQNLTNTVSLLNNQAIPAWQRYLQLVSLPATGVAGVIGLFDTAEEIAKKSEEAAKIQEEANKKVQESITKQALQGLEAFGKTEKGLEALRVAYASNVNGVDIYKEALSIVQAELKAETEALLKATEAQIEKNKALEKAAKLAAELSEIERGARIATLERSYKDPSQTLGGFTATDPQAEITFNQAVAASYDSISAAIARANLKSDDYAKSIENQQAAWLQFATVSGHAISQAIEADQSLSKSAAAVTASIIDGSQQRIAAYLGEGIAKAFAINPIAGAAIATAGLAVISGLLRKYARRSEGSSAYGSSPSVNSVGEFRSGGSGVQSSTPVLETQVRGQDLWVVLKNYETSKYSTHG